MLRKKLEHKKNLFSLKTVLENDVQSNVQFEEEKSAGVDGISQENLVFGAKALVVPLTWIINNSIANGEFSEMWKEALVTPILKERRANKERKLQTSQLFVSSIKSTGKNCMRPSYKLHGNA